MDNYVDPGADGAPAEGAVTVIETGSSESFNSVSAAARALASHRYRKGGPAGAERSEPTSAPAAMPEPAPSTPDAGIADAPPPEDESGALAAAPPELPGLAPPATWSADARERWRALDRDVQQYLVDRDRHESLAAEKARDELAANRKAIDAERTKASEARQHYEAALPALLQIIQAQQADEFADIKGAADIERMAREDMPRYVKWTERQRQARLAVEQVEAAQERAAKEAGQQWTEFARRQDDLFVEHVPDMADKAKAARLQEAAVLVLKEIGFAEQELGHLWTGQRALSLRDHRVQLLILDGIRYREAQAKARQAAAKPVPPVQRPGVSQPRGAQADAEIQALNQKLETAKGSNALKIAAQLTAARRAQAR